MWGIFAAFATKSDPNRCDRRSLLEKPVANDQPFSATMSGTELRPGGCPKPPFIIGPLMAMTGYILFLLLSIGGDY